MPIPPDMCCICGFPEGACRLIRLSWINVPSDHEFKIRLIVVKVPKSNDALVCDDCIRGIKRIPFGEIAQAQKDGP